MSLPPGIARCHLPYDRVLLHIFNNVSPFHYREIPEEWNRIVVNFIEMSYR